MATCVEFCNRIIPVILSVAFAACQAVDPVAPSTATMQSVTKVPFTSAPFNRIIEDTATPSVVGSSKNRQSINATSTPLKPIFATETAKVSFSSQTSTMGFEEWKTLPVIPELSPRALEILNNGLASGNDPHVFSKIGDCESQTDWFLDPFDRGPRYYDLGTYEDELRPVIDHYQGSFSRKSLAARRGFTAASLLSPIWADQEYCDDEESPLACELRINNPSVAFIMLGTNDASNPVVFECRLREVIEYTLSRGVLPILGTKADNLEGDHSINYTIASLAREYELPLWNFWAAVQPLPGFGLSEDGAHLTFAGPFYDKPHSLQSAWPVRNLNALQILLKVLENSGQ